MTQASPARGVLARQAAILLVGVLVALGMGWMGLWQAGRAIESGEAGIRDRATQPAVELLPLVRADGTVGDVYGRQVVVSGTFLPQRLLVAAPAGRVRVVDALQVPDGRLVPVVRGLRPLTGPVPAPPAGVQRVTGIFLPGEGDAPGTDGVLGSVRTPLIAQLWPQQIVPGFITLDAAGAATQGLDPASVTLPQGEKSLQNGSYALQWWVFAAFALAMAWKLAHDVGVRARRRNPVPAPPDGVTGSPPTSRT